MVKTKTVHLKACANCRTLFYSTHPNANQCRPGCQRTEMVGGDWLTCKGCGHAFKPRRRSGNNSRGRAADANTYCSRECAFRYKSENGAWITDFEIWYKDCPECGKRFSSRRSNTVACSDWCRDELSRKAVNAKYEPVAKTIASSVCVECGASFEYVMGIRGIGTGRKVVFCSKACSRKDSRRRRKVRTRVGMRSNAARFNDVWDRDSGKCYLCGEWCNRSLKVPHPLAPTMDHVIPVSFGGPHVMENAAIAHHVCNCTKGVDEVTDSLKSLCRQAVQVAVVGGNPWQYVAEARLNS